MLGLEDEILHPHHSTFIIGFFHRFRRAARPYYSEISSRGVPLFEEKFDSAY
jgi:hypothetical protein